MIEAQGKKGRIFQYHLIHERCLSFELGPEPDVADVEDLLKSQRSASRSRTVKPVTGTIKQLDRPTLELPGEEEGQATDCFGGYRAPTRARLDNFFAADNLGYILTIDQTHQLIENGRWTDLFTQITSSWEVPVSGTGLTNAGHEYEILDRDGNSLASDGEDVSWIASGDDVDDASADDLPEKCVIKTADYYEDQRTAGEEAYVHCKNIHGKLPDFTDPHLVGSATGDQCDIVSIYKD